MKVTSKMLKVLPDLIREASKTQLSILAFGMLAITILAFVIIQNQDNQTIISLIIFSFLLALVAFLGWFILSQTEPDKSENGSEDEIKKPKPDAVLRPLVAVLNLNNTGNREELEPQCFGISSYLRRVLESIPTSYRFGVVPNSELVGIHRERMSRSQILKETGAVYLFEGSLDLRGDPCQIDVHLSLTTDQNEKIWSKSFIEPQKNIQSVIKSIAAIVVEKTLLHSQPADDPELQEKIDRIRKTIDEVPEQPIKVFEAFNRGIFNQNRFNNLRKDEYFQEAVFQLKNAAKMATPSYIDALAQLAFLYILKWETSSSPHWLEKSEEKWNEIRKKKPNNPFALVELAYVSLVRGSSEAVDAVKLARRAVDIHPDDPIANNVLALMYLYLGFYESCIKMEENKVFTLIPTYIYPLANVALAQQLRGNHDKAHALASKAKEIEPTSFITSLLIGAQYYYQGNLRNAEQIWAEGRKHCTEDIASILDVTQAWIRAREGDLMSAGNTIRENRDAPWLRGPYGPYFISLCALAGEEELAVTMLESEVTFARNYRYLVSEPTLFSLKQHPRFKTLLEKRYEEWQKNVSELKKGLTNPVDAYLPDPDEFVKLMPDKEG